MSAAQPSRPSRPADRVSRRSEGLHHVRGVTRWAVIGSAASTLVLGLGYAHALPDLAALLPSHLSGGGGGITDDTGGSGGVQAPGPGVGGQSGHTSTGAS